MNEPIEQYLDELYTQLRGGDPRRARRILDEAADHLHGTAATLEASGKSRDEAEHEAVRRFGPSAPLARADRSLARLVLETMHAVVFLGAVGLVAVGVSGIVVAAMNALFGKDFVGAQLPDAFVLPSGPPATVAENANDAVSLRVLAGLVGLVLLGVIWVVRRARHGIVLRVLPPAYVDTAALVAFGGATVVLAAGTIDQLVNHGGHGAGFFLSGAIVSVVGAAVFGTRAVRSLLAA